MQVLTWNVADDHENIRPGAIDLRSKSAANRFLPRFRDAQTAQKFLMGPTKRWRWGIVSRLPVIAGRPIAGTILEIGAGTAWCSAQLSKLPGVKHVYALEYDASCVHDLMPRVMETLGARHDRVTGIVGSFNKMEFTDNSIDIVVALGALHHSENLGMTLRECFRILKPGGVLLACEPTHPNDSTQHDIRTMEEAEISPERARQLYGDVDHVIHGKDNSDHFYRLCEYEAASFSAGFNVKSLVFDGTRRSGGFPGLAWRFVRDMVLRDRTLMRSTGYRGFDKTVLYPYFAVHNRRKLRAHNDALTLLLEKP